MSLVGDGELAVTEGVPELDGAIPGSRDNLAVVGGEGNGENVASVSNEAAGGETSRELPQAESLIPRSRQSVGTIRRDDLFLSQHSILSAMFRTGN